MGDPSGSTSAGKDSAFMMTPRTTSPSPYGSASKNSLTVAVTCESPQPCCRRPISATCQLMLCAAPGADVPCACMNVSLRRALQKDMTDSSVQWCALNWIGAPRTTSARRERFVAQSRMMSPERSEWGTKWNGPPSTLWSTYRAWQNTLVIAFVLGCMPSRRGIRANVPSFNWILSGGTHFKHA